MKRYMDKLNIKIKNFCFIKYPVKKSKRQKINYKLGGKKNICKHLTKNQYLEYVKIILKTQQ